MQPEKPLSKQIFNTIFFSGGKAWVPTKIYEPNWVKSVEPCSETTFVVNNNKFLVNKEDTGPVTINGFPVTDADHRRALSGEIVQLSANKKVATLTMKQNTVMFDGKPLSGMYIASFFRGPMTYFSCMKN